MLFVKWISQDFVLIFLWNSIRDRLLSMMSDCMTAWLERHIEESCWYMATYFLNWFLLPVTETYTCTHAHTHAHRLIAVGCLSSRLALWKGHLTKPLTGRRNTYVCSKPSDKKDIYGHCHERRSTVTSDWLDRQLVDRWRQAETPTPLRQWWRRETEHKLCQRIHMF